MKHILLIALGLCILLGAQAQLTTTMTISYQDTLRQFIVHLPPAYTPGGAKLPLVFNHHGYTSNANQQQVYSGMNATADANSFIVVYPNGLNQSWNSGFAPPYNGTFPDDVGFISKIIDTMYALYNINASRVYSCGMSNGGFQSYRLACDLENRIAAVASVTGSMTTTMTTNCTLSRPVPVLEIHGTMDATVPYGGATGVLGAEDVVTFWANKNNCSTTVRDTIIVPNTNTADGSTVQKIKFHQCATGEQVWLYKVIGGAHTWPGASIPIGTTNQDINASQEIWDFFNQYTLNGPAVGIDEPVAAMQLSLYPNPANSTITIEASENINSITIYNLLGEKMMQRNMNAAQAQLNIAELNSGIYLVSIKANNQTYTKRFTKQ